MAIVSDSPVVPEMTGHPDGVILQPQVEQRAQDRATLLQQVVRRPNIRGVYRRAHVAVHEAKREVQHGGFLPRRPTGEGRGVDGDHRRDVADAVQCVLEEGVELSEHLHLDPDALGLDVGQLGCLQRYEVRILAKLVVETKPRRRKLPAQWPVLVQQARQRARGRDGDSTVAALDRVQREVLELLDPLEQPCCRARHAPAGRPPGGAKAPGPQTIHDVPRTQEGKDEREVGQEQDQAECDES